MSTTDAERLAAGLAEDEAKVLPMRPARDGPWMYSCAGLPGMHQTAERAIADIAAKRHILALYEEFAAEMEHQGERFAHGGPPPGGGIVTGTEVLGSAVAALAAVYGEPAENAGTPAHAYLSTSCLHAAEPGREDLHGYCQSATGSNGETEWVKAPASCKFCGAPCTCSCHGRDAPAETVT